VNRIGMPIVAMTQEMASLGGSIGAGVARALGHELLRHDLIRQAAREYRVREKRLVGAVEQAPRLLERLGRRARRYQIYLEAAVLDAALRGEVVLMGRWSTLVLRGVRHAVRVRVCASAEVRASRVQERLGVDRQEALRRITAYDEGVRARMRQLFDVDWSDPLLYDVVINTDAVSVDTAIGQLVALARAAEFQPTEAARADLESRATAARVRATLKADAGTARTDLDVRATGGSVRLGGLVDSDAERDAAVIVARGVRGVTAVQSDVRVFRRPLR
jgi:cytidylate kinase